MSQIGQKLGEGCRRLALTAFAGFLIASATQAACTQTVADGPPVSATCAAGETAKKLGTHDTCCSTIDGETKCHEVDALQIGGACANAGETRAATVTEFVADVCVVDSCDGNKTSTDFADTTVQSTGTAQCTSGDHGSTWQWNGAPASHTVVRACSVVGFLACGGAGSGYGSYGYGYGSYGYGSYGQPSYGYGTGYGYGYGYGAGAPKRRDVTVVSSTCAPASAQAASPCGAGDL